jgi:hypothetical protein
VRLGYLLPRGATANHSYHSRRWQSAVNDKWPTDG